MILTTNTVYLYENNNQGPDNIKPDHNKQRWLMQNIF